MQADVVIADVVIAGGGIAGLTTALLLAKQGFTIALFEQAPAFSEVGAGLQLSPNATRILRGLDLLPQVKAVALEPDTLIVRTGHSGQILTRLPLKARAKLWDAPYYVTHRADLLQVLLTRAKTMPNIRLYTGHRLASANQSRRDVTFEFASLDGARLNGEASGKIGLGADGLRSRLADVMFGDAQTAPIFSGKIAYRTTIPASIAPAFAKSADVTLWLGAKTHCVHYPLEHSLQQAHDTNGLINLVVIVDGAAQDLLDDWDNAATAKTLSTRLQNFAPEFHDLLQRASAWRAWPLYHRQPLPSYHHGRFALLGDAAHPMLPHLAQGAAQAIEDAHGLALCLTNADEPALALLAYNKARYQHTQAIVKAAQKQGAIYHLSGAAALARNTLLRLGNPQALLARYDWIYSFGAEREP